MVQDRMYMLKTYKSCFVANEALDFFISLNIGRKYPGTFGNLTKSKVVVFFQLLIDVGFIVHVVDVFKPFSDEYLFFKFCNSNGVDKEYLLSKMTQFRDLKQVCILTRSLDSLNQFYWNIKQGVEIKDRSWRLRTFPKCFVGTDLCTMIQKQYALGKIGALALGEKMRTLGCFDHVAKQHKFEDDYFFYELMPFNEFSARCLKAVSECVMTPETRKFEMTKDEIYRHLGKQDIDNVIMKNRIYLDEKYLSHKNITQLSGEDLHVLCKTISIEAILKVVTPETLAKIDDTVDVIRKMIWRRPNGLIKDLHGLMVHYSDSPGHVPLLNRGLVKLKQIFFEIRLCEEELRLWLKTSEEIIRDSNDWSRILSMIPIDKLNEFAIISGKRHLIPESFKTFKLDMAALEALLNCLPKKELIRYCLAVKSMDMQEAEKSTFANKFLYHRSLLSGLLDIDRFKFTIPKILENKRVRAFLIKDPKFDINNVDLESLWTHITKNHIVSALALAMMKTQDVLWVDSLDKFKEYFSPVKFDENWTQCYEFMRDFHEIKFDHDFDFKSKYIESLSVMDVHELIATIPSQDYEEIKLFHVCGEKIDLSVEKMREILLGIPKDDLESYQQSSSNRKSSPSGSYRLKSFVTMFHYVMSQENDEYCLNGVFHKVFELFQQDRTNFGCEYQVLDPSKSETKAIIVKRTTNQCPLWIRDKGFLVAISDDYIYENGEFYFPIKTLNRSNFLKRTDLKSYSISISNNVQFISSVSLKENDHSFGSFNQFKIRKCQ